MSASIDQVDDKLCENFLSMRESMQKFFAASISNNQRLFYTNAGKIYDKFVEHSSSSLTKAS